MTDLFCKTRRAGKKPFNYYLRQIVNNVIMGSNTTMSTKKSTAFSSTLIIFSTSLLCLLMGLAVMVGWHTHNTSLIQISDSFAPMQYNTALGFVASGLGLFFLSSQWLFPSLLSGFFLFILGIATLSQYIFGIDLFIDELLMKGYIFTKTSHPGRMAPNTALCFLIFGTILLNKFFHQASKHKHIVTIFLSLLIFVMSSLALLGYLIDVEEAYGWTNLTRMAFHTSLGFFALSMGCLFYTSIHKTEGGITLSYVSISIIIAIFSIILWENLQSHENLSIQQEIEGKSLLITESISNNINASVTTLERMANRWEKENGTPQGRWTSDAQNAIRDNIALTTLEWVDRTYHVRWIEPLSGNEKALDLSIDFDDERKESLAGARQKDTITLTPPLNLVQGYKA
ncbi:CHASE domain-containing protein, partial [Alphaproteobacteria bacterium]|nr:CHASE domain-containing protein [Alphaproteobacteria bacterium]